MENEKPIFLRLCSKKVYYYLNETYSFFVNGNKKYKKQCDCKEVYELSDPSIDATFKYLFTSNKDLLADLLNSILFPERAELSHVNIINGEINKPGQKQNKGTIRADIGCSAKYKNEEIIIGIEMQLGDNEDNFTERLLNYNAGLRLRNDLKKTWTIGLLIKANKNVKDDSSKTKLNKAQNGKTYELDLLEIVAVDLYSLVEKINIGEEIEINKKKIGIRGKEWLKLLALRTWCPEEFGKFVLPKGYTLSNNEKLNKAIEILSTVPYDIINNSIEEERALKEYYNALEKSKKEGIIEGEIKGEIKNALISSFELFIDKCDLKFVKKNLRNKKFKKEDVDLYLKEYSEKYPLELKQFVDLLKNDNYISN